MRKECTPAEVTGGYTQQISGSLLNHLSFYGAFNSLVFADSSLRATQTAFVACGLGVKYQTVQVLE
jgi:hypothetical protein